jgi:hypothetical protein
LLQRVHFVCWPTEVTPTKGDSMSTQHERGGPDSSSGLFHATSCSSRLRPRSIHPRKALLIPLHSHSPPHSQGPNHCDSPMFPLGTVPHTLHGTKQNPKASSPSALGSHSEKSWPWVCLLPTMSHQGQGEGRGSGKVEGSVWTPTESPVLCLYLPKSLV